MAGIVALKAGDTNVLIAVRRNPNDVTSVTNIDDKINDATATLQSKFGVIRGIAVDLSNAKTPSMRRPDHHAGTGRQRPRNRLTQTAESEQTDPRFDGQMFGPE
jgi:hypothetical protein